MPQSGLLAAIFAILFFVKSLTINRLQAKPIKWGPPSCVTRFPLCILLMADVLVEAEGRKQRIAALAPPGSESR